MDAALHLDFETRSAADLKKVGVHRYAEDPSTAVIVACYRFGEGEVRGWRPLRGEPAPYEVISHVAEGGRVIAHNAAFERTIWNRFVGSPLIPLRPEQQDCTMARAAALGLPQGLDQLGQVLNAAFQKDKEGHRLMMAMCKPRRRREDGTFEWRESPEDVERLTAYCAQDVLTECAVDQLLPQLSADERECWIMDQQINDRGFAVDLVLVRRAIAAVEEAAKRADRDMWALTNGAVRRCTETAKIIAWVAAQGIPCTSIAKGGVDELIAGAQLHSRPDVEAVLSLRRAAAKSSNAKYGAMELIACADGRVRGSLAWHAAHTGRWGGRGVQAQNFPRVESFDSDFKPEDVAAVVGLLESALSPEQVVDSLVLLFAKPLDALSKCLRSMIIDGSS